MICSKQNALPVAQYRYALVAMALLLFPVLVVTAKQQHKTIVNKVQIDSPVKIKDVKVSRKSVVMDQPFTVSQSWLDNLTVTVENTATKNIVYVQMGLEFLPGDGKKYPVVTKLKAGLVPNLPKRGEASPLVLPLGRDITLSLPTVQRNILKQNISANEMSDNVVNVMTEMVIFDDGTAWRHGKTLRQDSNDPRRWNVVEENGNAQAPIPLLNSQQLSAHYTPASKVRSKFTLAGARKSYGLCASYLGSYFADCCDDELYKMILLKTKGLMN